MFRNPRSATFVNGKEAATPSTGRPPTPPSAGATPMAASTAVRGTASSSTPPLTGRKGPSVGQIASSSRGKAKSKANSSILKFFKPADTISISHTQIDDEGEQLFLESSPAKPQNGVEAQFPTPPQDGRFGDSVILNEESDVPNSPLSRFNEDEAPSKRRKTDPESRPSIPPSQSRRASMKRGPFLDESDNEENDAIPTALSNDQIKTSVDESVNNHLSKSESEKEEGRPTLKREATSVGEIDEFEGVEDFIDDEFPDDGEEFLERRWMEEQDQLEMGLQDEDERLGLSDTQDQMSSEREETESKLSAVEGSSCPMCGGNTTGLTDQQISIHVNDCLDGKAKPLSKEQGASPAAASASTTITATTDVPNYKRFYKAAIAKPGQENPFNLTNTTSDPTSSAFSKIMSGHAEDNAWAAAAASETASRGKPAYQRTCPFYKIMPGFSICVDAFRYGAVQGCNAYFLSHFHSDHYIGLTSLWCHGPIYCSRVTGNLVRRQLRVDPKWVVDLEFEKKMVVPNTQGVEVTMIPANHCPGSSLFFFEKVIGKGKNPKIQRVLHCGDFRACPAHVKHPKLRSDILDTATGRVIAQQKIDVCYLDTTYLTPKYAFPSQAEVIRACSEMCVSLSKNIVDKNDSWEQTKRERAGAGMVKFVQKNGETEGECDAEIKIEDQPIQGNKSRGRLLVIVGTYSIGKERICLGVAKALNSKIYAPPNKQKVVAALEDPELSALMTNDPLEAQVHMQMLMEIRAETLADYLTGYKPHFSRIVGFRPSGWNYRPPNSRFTESPSVQTVLYSDNWKSKYSMSELVPQRGSTREAHCFGVPYSEHSSFRELTLFCCALRIDKIIPTVNVGSAKSREKMKGWFEKWAAEKKKNGLLKIEEGQVAWT